MHHQRHAVEPRGCFLSPTKRDHKYLDSSSVGATRTMPRLAKVYYKLSISMDHPMKHLELVDEHTTIRTPSKL